MGVKVLGEIIPSQELRAGRMLAGGRLTVTMTSKKTGSHLTLEFATKLKNNGPGPNWKDATWAEAVAKKGMVFVNTNGRDRIGTFFPDSGKFSPARGADPARVWAAENTLLSIHHGVMDTDKFRLQEESVCGKCGRALTDPVSIDRGIGPECYGQMTGSEHQLKVRQPQQTTQAQPFEARVQQATVPQAEDPAPAVDAKGRNVPKTFAELAERLGK